MNKRYYIIGLPDSGKSTFLAALGFYLINGGNKDSIYRLGDNDDLDYISDLSSTWAKCEELERTNINASFDISLRLVDDTGNIIEIIMPDRSGESFRNIIKNRQIEEDMFEDISSSDKILLFINPSKISNDSFICEIAPQYRNQDVKKIEIENNNTIHEQAEYVELLQYIGKMNKEITNYKIIISAWDQYEGYKNPEELLKNRLPLIWQYINTNKDLFNCEYWGISAQGGDLTDRCKKEELASHNNACDRIIVVDEKGDISNDISKVLI